MREIGLQVRRQKFGTVWIVCEIGWKYRRLTSSGAASAVCMNRKKRQYSRQKSSGVFSRLSGCHRTFPLASGSLLSCSSARTAAALSSRRSVAELQNLPRVEAAHCLRGFGWRSGVCVINCSSCCKVFRRPAPDDPLSFETMSKDRTHAAAPGWKKNTHGSFAEAFAKA